MSQVHPMPTEPLDDEPVYPDADGEPLANNTTHLDWIIALREGLDAVLDGFVAADLLWYPVKGSARIRVAPDVLVVLARPKGHRGAYVQHREHAEPPTAVFEIVSPSNTPDELAAKLDFFDRYGAGEAYLYDHDAGTLRVWLREAGRLVEVPTDAGVTSPRMGLTFDLDGKDLVVTCPDGSPLPTPARVRAQRDDALLRADLERQRADLERQRAEHERQRAEHERQRADLERQRADRLAARLRALGVDPS